MWTVLATVSAGRLIEVGHLIIVLVNFSFDGCANVCYGQARAVVRPAPSFANPERRRNPAQRRRKPAGQTLESVAAAGQRCIDKIEQVEEIEYDEVVSVVVMTSYGGAYRNYSAGGM